MNSLNDAKTEIFLQNETILDCVRIWTLSAGFPSVLMKRGGTWGEGGVGQPNGKHERSQM